MHRVAFEPSEKVGADCYSMKAEASREDLKQVPGHPSEGLVVVIYRPGEVQTEARLEWNARETWWVARPINPFRPYLEMERDNLMRFPEYLRSERRVPAPRSPY